MDEQIRRKILSLLNEHRIMTIATLRPGGWPQATTGLSMAVRAQLVDDPAEAEKALRPLMLKYPQQASITRPMPTPADVRISA